MISVLLNPLTKWLLIVAFLAMIVACSTTYLYLGTRDKLVELEARHTQLKQVLKECSEGKSKVVEGAQQDDTLNVEKETVISTLEDEKKSLLKRLDTLSKKKCITSTTTLEKLPNETINPRASWDADIQQLLNETYDRNKRETNPTP